MANSLQLPLNDVYVVLKPKVYIGNTLERIFLCESGFGCKPNTLGTSIYGYFVYDGEKCRINGGDILRLATDKEISLAKNKVRGIEGNKLTITRQLSEINGNTYYTFNITNYNISIRKQKDGITRTKSECLKLALDMYEDIFQVVVLNRPSRVNKIIEGKKITTI